MPFIDFPSGRQTFEFDCGAKALQLVMAYYGVDIREGDLILKLRTDQQGTRPADMVRVAESYGFTASVQLDCSLTRLKQYIDYRTPVIVVLQAWSDHYMSYADWRNTNEHGHYAVAIGYDEHIVLFEDPAAVSHTWLTIRDFLNRWHDVETGTGRLLNRFALVLGGRQPELRLPQCMG
jgi:predicted double-glycine peptidase